MADWTGLILFAWVVSGMLYILAIAWAASRR